MTQSRKDRLAALKAKAGRNAKIDESSADKDTSIETTAVTEQQSVKFRNYTPKDSSQSGESEAKRPKIDNVDESSALEAALAEARAEAQATSANKRTEDENDAVMTAAPRKINADLKRYIQPKLDKLERRTQRAIVELLKARLEEEATGDLD